MSGGDLVCAECGATGAGTFVVTLLDATDPKGSRTEVCLACHQFLVASEAPTSDLQALVDVLAHDLGWDWPADAGVPSADDILRDLASSAIAAGFRREAPITEAMVDAGARAMYRMTPSLSVSGARSLFQAALEAAGCVR